jgi:DNA-binding protein H-NS
MEDFQKIIAHFRRFKSAVKQLRIEDLEEIKVKLSNIIEDRKAEAEAMRLENEERTGKVKKYREMLAKDGIELDELQATMPEKKPKTKQKAKYELWDDKGKRVTWTGQGRMPNILKDHVNAGESLTTFLID